MLCVLVLRGRTAVSTSKGILQMDKLVIPTFLFYCPSYLISANGSVIFRPPLMYRRLVGQFRLKKQDMVTKPQMVVPLVFSGEQR